MNSEFEFLWYVHPVFEKNAKAFEEKYDMVKFVMIGDPQYSKKKIRNQKDRHCIFCDKSYPEVEFKNASHLISKMIGNTDLYSTFECDSCNNKFSQFETDLSYFLGLSRSISGMYENRKTPGFAGIGLNAKSFYYKGKKLLVIKNSGVEKSDNVNTAKLSYNKPTYTPENIYKLFLKCSLSILPSEEVIKDYKLALQYLHGGYMLNGAHINMYQFPSTINMPLHVCVFKRKSGTDSFPVHLVVFYFSNLVVIVPVLLHLEDLKYLDQKVEIMAAPLYLLECIDLMQIMPKYSSCDLSSPKKLKNDSEEVIFQFNKDDTKNKFLFDVKSGEVKQSDYITSDSKYFIVTENGQAFSTEELAELTKEIDILFS